MTCVDEDLSDVILIRDDVQVLRRSTHVYLISKVNLQYIQKLHLYKIREKIKI